MTKKKTTNNHPVVDGTQTTFTAIGKELGVTPSAAAQKYHRIKAVHPKVSFMLMRARFVSPTVLERRMENLIEREYQDLVRLIRLHGPMHAAMVKGMDYEAVKRVARDADRQDRRRADK